MYFQYIGDVRMRRVFCDSKRVLPEFDICAKGEERVER